MRRSTDLPGVWLLTLLCLVGLFAGSPLTGQDHELAETVPLNADLLVVEVWNADLDVFVSADTKPVLRTEAAPQGYSIDVDLRLAEQASSGVTTMHFRRAIVAGREDARLRVEMLVNPAQQLRIAGTELNITLESRQEARPIVAVKNGASRVELALEDSEATLTGLRDLRGETIGTSLRLAETRGALDLKLTSGVLEVSGHQGSLKLAATEADIELADFEGDLEADLQGGSLRMNGGAGTWVGQARDALLFFGGWQGELELTAWNSTFQAHGSAARTPLWKLSGVDLAVILEETEGALEIDLAGGRLQARGIRGDGKTHLKLSGGAEARLAAVDGALAVAVEDGELEVDEVAVLELSATRSTVSLGGVHDLRRLYATDTALVVDLTATAPASRVLIGGQSDAEVLLAMPCVVKISAASTAPVSQVEVAGCELRLPRRGRLQPLDQGSPFVLTVTLNGESTLEAEGQR